VPAKQPPLVSDLMTRDPLVVAHADDSVRHAARMMAAAEIRHLPVVDELGALVGIVSQRDLLACDDREARVGDIMSEEVVTVAPETAAYEAALLLWTRRIGCVPVTCDDGSLVGLLTESDFVRVAYALLGGRGVIDDLVAEEREP
jgi:CBS domain-containing protein